MLDHDSYTIETLHPVEASNRRDPRSAVALRTPSRSGRVREHLNGTARILALYRDIDMTASKRWLIDEMLGEGELSVWYGPPGCGKSVLAGDAACHVAAGRPWHGHSVERGGVLYVAAERGALVKRRIAAWRKHSGLHDIPLAVVEGGFDLCTSHDNTDDLIATVEAFEEAIRDKCCWIIIDTKAQVMGGGDENNAADVGRLVANLTHLQRVTAAHVTIIDHTPHDAPHRMRGHGALLGAADSTFRIAKGERVRTMAVDKANDGPDDVRVAFSLESVELGTDPRTGKMTTAPIVVQAEPDKAGQSSLSGQARLTNAETLALRLLYEVLADVGCDPPLSTTVPQQAKVVTERQWRDLCYQRSIAGTERQDARQKAFKRAADGLQRKGRIGVSGELVWLT